MFHFVTRAMLLHGRVMPPYVARPFNVV